MVIKERKRIEEWATMEPKYFHDMVKGVCDVENGIIALHAEMHVDLEQELLDAGSEQENLVGFNIYYDGDIELDSKIDPPVNRRLEHPRSGRLITDPEMVKKVTAIVRKWVDVHV